MAKPIVNPLRCTVELSPSGNPVACDAVPCGELADIVCMFCEQPICTNCERETSCPFSTDLKHHAEPEPDIYPKKQPCSDLGAVMIFVIDQLTGVNRG